MQRRWRRRRVPKYSSHPSQRLGLVVADSRIPARVNGSRKERLANPDRSQTELFELGDPRPNLFRFVVVEVEIPHSDLISTIGDM